MRKFYQLLKLLTQSYSQLITTSIVNLSKSNNLIKGRISAKICLVITFCVFAFLAKAGTYYSNSTNPTSVVSWWTNTNGTGSNPANFTTPGDIFILQTGQTCSTAGNWTIGSGVTLQIDGTLAINGGAMQFK